MGTTIRPAIVRTLLRLAVILCAAPTLTNAALANAALADASLCERAARTAAQETGVSLALLRAIMLAESGRDIGQGRAAWPWTLQSQGRGHWLTSADDALAAARDLIAAGETNIDLGCFQINLGWHGKAFASLAAMLDPDTNARYAAGYLQELYAQTGDWRSAAGAYHSRDADRAETYVTRLVTLHNETAAAPTAEPDPTPRPIIRAGGPIIVLGSLAGPLIGGLR